MADEIWRLPPEEEAAVKAEYRRSLERLSEVSLTLWGILNRIPKITVTDGTDDVLRSAWGDDTPAGASVSAKELRINAPWFMALVAEDKDYILAHEATHIAQRLGARMKWCPPSSKKTWCMAIDMAANCLVEQCGVRRRRLREGCHCEDHGFPPDLSVEQYIALIQKKYGMDEDDWRDEKGNRLLITALDSHDLAQAADAGDDDPPLTEDGILRAALDGTDDADRTKRILIRALGNAKKRDWRNILREMLSGRVPGGRNFCRPSRRWDGEGALIPGNIRQVLPRVAFVVDFSVSMTSIIAQTADELVTIAKEFTGGRYAFIGCDHRVQCFFENTDKGMPKTAADILNLYTAGATDMSPAFTLAKSKGYTQIICLTDLEVPDDNLPEQNVLWVWKSKNTDRQKDMKEYIAKNFPTVRHVCVG